MSLHIGAGSGEIAETVLLPGDPMRANWVAERFLSDPACINRVRGMLGYTGTWNGHRVTVHGTGMGMPSLAIYVTELLRHHGARTLVRIGSCGAMQPDLSLGEIVLAMTASSLSTPSRAALRELNFAPAADWGLLCAAERAACAFGIVPRIGGIYSADAFYDERPDLTDDLRRHGTLAVEMETAELYMIAAREGARALSVLTVSDQPATGAAMTPEERETGLEKMVEIALAAAFD
ncbi:purine-nucleoside phosphorylase [Maritimibacter sp. 55A14]|uniref:purine-nucleoside phosphorylase n=1 Tax=Maritimibacter sp. 55A14 TaxID=2174844 RepID=UPI000D60B12B|nr:purine-nucleoside phosphorylase [Maritimibacter sp. 55A14]PWE29270.1 purine-nucleoside phosphorylase [Maritimibacter sp. 55A14]